VSIPSEIAQRFVQGELIAAIAQEESTGEVLMLAWMNEAALLSTLETKRVTYWSRSRNSLWIKGETSGNTQELVSISYDCDADALLVKGHQQGGACHTGERTCFHREITP
jgi:phosphoribosyl-AMP cyclohydrolase